MIYLSKLAKRLALAARISGVFAVSLMACSPSEEREFLDPNNPQSSTVVSLTVEPRIGTVRPGDVIHFKATAKNVMGNAVSTAIDWTATGGVIEDDGTFTADLLGQFQVTAKLRNNSTIADSALVSVFLHPNDVIALELTSSGEVTVGEGIQLEAVAELADGRIVRQPPLAWTALIGEVDGGGYYTAPEIEGVYEVKAKALSGVSAQTAVRVQAGKRVLQTVTIEPSAVTLSSGQSRQFSATGTYDDGTSKPIPVLWSSAGGTIGNDGLFTAGSTAGTYQVVARFKQGTQADTATVTVTQTQIVGVQVSPDGASLTTGAAQQYLATARMSDGTTRPVGAAWQATGGSINSNGLYSAGSAAGSYRVIAAVAGSGFADTVSVTVSAPAVTLTAVTVSPSNSSMAVGTTRQFQVTGTWSDGSTQVPPVSWNATGGTVTSGGLYQAGNITGTYHVIATASSWGKADTAVVVVGAAELTSLVISPATASANPGDTRQFTVTGTWSDGSNTVPLVNWTAEGGTITPNGFYSAASTPGTFPVIATHSSGLADTSLVTIAPPPPVLLSLSLTPASANLAPGTSIQFEVTGTWSEGGSGPPPVTYSATGGSITTSGRYTAGNTAGTYRVIASHTGGSKADTSTIVIAPSAPTLTSLTISPASTSLQTGASRQFSVSGVWSDGSTTTPAVSWSTNGGTISSAGLYLAPGTAGTYRVIAVQVGGTEADTADVTVTAAATIVSLEVTPGQRNLLTGQSQQFMAQATYSNGGTGTPTIAWSASGGTVSSGGMYTAPQSAGQYKVIAQASGSTVRDTAEVQVSPPQVTALALSPSSVALVAGSTQQFYVTSTWSDGATRSITPAYSATGGTVSSSGLYTAGTSAGAYRVIVTCASNGCSVADTATVTIQTTSSGSTVSSLTIGPKTITLDVGEVYQFGVTARLTDGSTSTSPTVTWSASNGEINGTGLYRAPRTAGTYTVTVRHSGGASDNATVTVRVPTGPYFTDNFDSCTLSKVANSQGFLWRDTGGSTTAEIPGIASGFARSGNCSLRFTFAGGGAGDDAWSEQRFALGKKLSEIYIQWYQYWPMGTESPSRGAKFVHRDDTGPDNNKFLRLWDEEYSKYRVKLGFSTMPRGTGDSNIITEYGTNLGGVGPFGSGYDPNGITNSRRGRWVKIAVHVRLATAANNDGVIEMWVDGVKTINNTTLPLYPDYGIGNYMRNGYLMGWANSGFSATSNTYIDDVIISGVPIP